ncbi:alpha/beta fold hydrolase [Actinomycetospora termitidis]|uniref:Alpha/beta hydrolase n=1 Tax=Actinomycetospora termitidis TaxID=3053470 RepID=A0ABT7M9V3_9PSEU|nr:alpha/beta hydrolase [Actinomycetospora sp. Odt1-22]MDL5157448.1 alpha/beta hydrolase [Actinomycetospora sp. Odt1-22]
MSFDLTVDDVRIHGERTGTGPPVLLLHGIPETHRMWDRVAEHLARTHTVVATDLRGYGGSSAPPTPREHSMRALAAEQVAVMRRLGYDRFAVVGHDRGARCAYRMALDHPDVVTRLGVLDVVPTAEAYARADREFALGYWVWSLLAAPAPVAEQLVLGAPRALVDHMLDSWSDVPVFDEARRELYAGAFRDPERVHAICEQYRAAATVDVEHDEADRGRGRMRCPVLVLWSATGAVDAWYDPLAVWRQWADDVTGHAVDAGHFLPEEAPEEVSRALDAFLEP